MEPKDIISGLGLAFSVFSMVYVHSKANNKALRDQVDEQATTVAALAAKVESLPTKDAFHQLELAVAEVRGSQRVLQAEIQPIALSVQRIERFLMDQPKSPRGR